METRNTKTKSIDDSSDYMETKSSYGDNSDYTDKANSTIRSMNSLAEMSDDEGSERSENSITEISDGEGSESENNTDLNQDLRTRIRRNAIDVQQLVIDDKSSALNLKLYDLTDILKRNNLTLDWFQQMEALLLMPPEEEFSLPDEKASAAAPAESIRKNITHQGQFTDLYDNAINRVATLLHQKTCQDIFAAPKAEYFHLDDESREACKLKPHIVAYQKDFFASIFFVQLSIICAGIEIEETSKAFSFNPLKVLLAFERYFRVMTATKKLGDMSSFVMFNIALSAYCFRDFHPHLSAQAKKNLTEGENFVAKNYLGLKQFVKNSHPTASSTENFPVIPFLVMYNFDLLNLKRELKAEEDQTIGEIKTKFNRKPTELELEEIHAKTKAKLEAAIDEILKDVNLAKAYHVQQKASVDSAEKIPEIKHAVTSENNQTEIFSPKTIAPSNSAKEEKIEVDSTQPQKTKSKVSLYDIKLNRNWGNIFSNVKSLLGYLLDNLPAEMKSHKEIDTTVEDYINLLIKYYNPMEIYYDEMIDDAAEEIAKKVQKFKNDYVETNIKEIESGIHLALQSLPGPLFKRFLNKLPEEFTKQANQEWVQALFDYYNDFFLLFSIINTEINSIANSQQDQAIDLREQKWDTIHFAIRPLLANSVMLEKFLNKLHYQAKDSPHEKCFTALFKCYNEEKFEHPRWLLPLSDAEENEICATVMREIERFANKAQKTPNNTLLVEEFWVSIHNAMKNSLENEHNLNNVLKKLDQIEIKKENRKYIDEVIAFYKNPDHRYLLIIKQIESFEARKLENKTNVTKVFWNPIHRMMKPLLRNKSELENFLKTLSQCKNEKVIACLEALIHFYQKPNLFEENLLNDLNGVLTDYVTYIGEKRGLGKTREESYLLTNLQVFLTLEGYEKRLVISHERDGKKIEEDLNSKEAEKDIENIESLKAQRKNRFLKRKLNKQLSLIEKVFNLTPIIPSRQQQVPLKLAFQDEKVHYSSSYKDLRQGIPAQSITRDGYLPIIKSKESLKMNKRTLEKLSSSPNFFFRKPENSLDPSENMVSPNPLEKSASTPHVLFPRPSTPVGKSSPQVEKPSQLKKSSSNPSHDFGKQSSAHRFGKKG